MYCVREGKNVSRRNIATQSVKYAMVAGIKVENASTNQFGIGADKSSYGTSHIAVEDGLSLIHI